MVKQDPVVEKTLDEIDQISHSLGIYVFAVGGFCRNLVEGKPHPVTSDIDLMADEYGGLKLAGVLASHYKVPIEFYHRTGTAHIKTPDGLDLEFQAFRPNYDVLQELRKINVPHNLLTFNVFSRDFTINTLIYSLRSKKIYDLTRMGRIDNMFGLLRTPIVSDVLVKSNPIIILRALMFVNRNPIYLISEELEIAMRKYVDSIPEALNERDIKKAVGKILAPDKQRGLKLLKKYNIDEIIDIEKVV